MEIHVFICWCVYAAAITTNQTCAIQRMAEKKEKKEKDRREYVVVLPALGIIMRYPFEPLSHIFPRHGKSPPSI